MVNEHLLLISQSPFYMLMWSVNKMDTSIFTERILDSNKDFIALSLLMQGILENEYVLIGVKNTTELSPVSEMVRYEHFTVCDSFMAGKRVRVLLKDWEPAGTIHHLAGRCRQLGKRSQECLKELSRITNKSRSKQENAWKGQCGVILWHYLPWPYHILLSSGNTSLLLPFKVICFRNVTNIFFLIFQPPKSVQVEDPDLNDQQLTTQPKRPQ